MEPRAYRGDDDRARMLALAALAAEETIHVVDLPYRLASWAFDCPETVALWERDGELLAWAVLQAPFWTLDYALHPAAPADTLAALLAWADGAATRLRPTPYGRPTWFAAVREGQAEYRWAFDAAGYGDQSGGDAPWSQVIMRRAGEETPPPVALRPGFAIRPLRGAAEVPSYVALHRAVFGTENMTAGWRAATLRAPGYRSEFDLVATDPDGELAAFVIGWQQTMAGGRVIGMVEPFGVREDARRYGLAWALMFELLRRFDATGAAEVRVMTDNYRDTAFAFYGGCGFQVIDRVLMLGKEVDNG